MRPIDQSKDQLLVILHFLDNVSQGEYIKMIQQLFDEIIFTQQFDNALSQQSQSFI